MHLAIDTMGGDYGPSVFVPAALAALERVPALRCTLLGDHAQLAQLISSSGIGPELSSRCELRGATPLDPLLCDGKAVLHSGRDSSLFKAIEMLSTGAADAAISGGSSAALLITGLRLLGKLPGVGRPAICKQLPRQLGGSYLLDLGANVDCSAQDLCDFARLGARMAHVQGRSQVSVGLLSNGREKNKGNKTLRQAARLLERSNEYSYRGFVEADEVFFGPCDIIVGDGLSGNIALKSAEGATRLLLTQLAEFEQEPKTRQKLTEHFSPTRHNGAVFLGLNGTLVKSHGNADTEACLQSILMTCDLLENGWLSALAGHNGR